MKKLHRLYLIALIGTVAASAAWATGGAEMAEQAASSELRVAISTEPWDLDPAIRTDFASEYIIKNVYDPLIEIDGNNQVTTQFAITRDWEWKNNGMTIVLYLREGIKFHDGSTLTASDVKYNFEWMLDEDNNSPWRAQVGPVESLTIVDDYTLDVTFSEPFADAVMMWSTAFYGIVPENSHGVLSEEKGTAGKAGTELSRNPVGSGPYKFVEWVSGSQVVLERFDDYWVDGVPAVDRVVFEFIGDTAAKEAALISGSVDIVDSIPFRDFTTLSDLPDVVTKRVPGTLLQIMYLNLSNPPLGVADGDQENKEAIDRALHVRKFLYHAIDRQAIADDIFYGMARVARGPWYPDSEWTSPKLKEMTLYDPDLARQHLSAAGYADGGLSLEIQATNASWFVDEATHVQEQLRRYGVDVQVVPVDKATLFDTMYESVEWDILLEDWGYADFSALSYLGFNYPWNNWSPNHWHHADSELRDDYHASVPGHKEWSDLYDQAVAEPDEQKRKELVWKLEEIIVDQVVGFDMLIVDNLYGWRESVQGYGDGLNSRGSINLRFITDYTGS